MADQNPPSMPPPPMATNPAFPTPPRVPPVGVEGQQQAGFPSPTAGGGGGGGTPLPPQFASPQQQYQQQQHSSSSYQDPGIRVQGQAIPAPVLDPETELRRKAADEAMVQAIGHVIHDTVKQEIEDATGVTAAREQADEEAKDGLHFRVGRFKYNIRLAILLGGAAVGILPVLGKATLVVLICCIVAVYILDYLNMKKATIFAILAALQALWAAMFAANQVDLNRSADAMLLITSISSLLAIVAAWAVLQFGWIQTEYPELALLLERVTMGLAPVASLPSYFGLIIGFVGARNAAFPLAALMCVVHWYFYTKHYSSFLTTLNPTLKKQTQITGEEEAAAWTLMTIFGPLLAYSTLHTTIDLAGEFPLHAFNTCGLLGLPLLYFVWNIRVTGWFLFSGGRITSISEAIAQSKAGNRLVQMRLPAAVIGYICLMHCIVYRVCRSRYGYLFAGLNSPMNELVLCFAGYCYTFSGVLIIRLTRSFDNPKTKLLCWLGCLLLSIFGTIFLGIVSGVPQFMMPLSALSVAAFSAFLMDPRQANNFMMFLFSSILLLLWWMYKTFSFIRQDLHVLGEAASISTQAVAVSVLWAYILGAIAFVCSLSKNATGTAILLVLHALKVTWVEHILYSQRENGAYPLPFVLTTSGLGIFMAYKLHKNGILTKDPAAAIAALYIGKLASYMYDVTSFRYVDLEYGGGENDNQLLFHAIETTLSYWCVTCCAWLLMVSPRTSLQMATIFIYCAVTAICQRNALVRWGLEAIFHDMEPAIFRTIGGILLLYSGMVFPFGEGNFRKFVTIPAGIGLSLVILDPSLEYIFSGGDVDEADISVKIPLYARLSAPISFALLGFSRLIPFTKGPRFGRLAYYTVMCITAALACIGPVIPYPDIKVMFCLIVFFVCGGLTIEVSHYTKNAESYVYWILYACCVVSMALAFVAMSHVDLTSFTDVDIYIWELHSSGRQGMLALAGVVNLFVAVLTKARVSGFSLLPRPIPLSPMLVQNVGLICNYSTLLAFVVFGMINFTTGSGNLPIYLCNATLLLLLHEDGIIFLELRGMFRYFLPFVGAVAPLWWTLVLESFAIAKRPLFYRIWHFATGLPVLPSQVSLLVMLYMGSAKKGGSSKILLGVCACLDIIVLLAHNSPAIRWMGVVNLLAHAGRLYASEFWKKRAGSLL